MTTPQIFLFLCLSFIVGVFVQSLLFFPWLLWPGVLILGIVLTALGWGRRKIAVVGFCLIAASAGAGRLMQVQNAPSTVWLFNDYPQKLVLVGRVVEEPDKRLENVRYKIKIEELGNGSQLLSVAGKALAVAKKYPEYHYGDKLELTGKLKTPPELEGFDYRQYLAKDDIHSVIYYPEIKLMASGQGNFIKEKLFWLKNKFEDSLRQILTEPQASLLAGLLLGEKRGFSPELIDNFSRTGTTHIVALSGYNITIIAVALTGLFNFFLLRRGLAFWLAVLIILLFVVMTGASASAGRAALMGILVLLAQQSGRLYNIRQALALAGALMIYYNPRILVWDLGFQLSFGATLGLVYVAPLFQNWWGLKSPEGLPRKSFLGWREILFATLAAQLAVLPLLVINFGQLSLIAPLANLLILFFIPATMFWGFLGGLAGILWPVLGKILVWPAWLFLTYEIKTIELLAAIPLAAIEIKWNWWLGAAYYLVLVYLIRWLNKKNKKTRLIGLVKNI